MAAYTTIDNPELYFQTKLWTGTGSSNALTLDGSENMQPDFVWIKLRAGAADYGHRLFDSVRGATKQLNTSATSAEGTETNSLSAFSSDGFTVVDADEVNQSGGSHTYVAWCWKMGTTSGISGTGNLTVNGYSFDSDAKQSVIVYTGNGGSSGTYTHGLGKAPGFIFGKNRDEAGDNWFAYHHKNTSAPETDYLAINTTAATADSDTYWNDTAPSSTLVTVGSAGEVNRAEQQVAYCFAEVQGYSKFGSYTGNGNADGPFVYTGFRPALVIIKDTGAAVGWGVYDNKRNGYNQDNKTLYAQGSSGEDAGGYVDLLSNGFKITSSSAWQNRSGGVFVYAAFAEQPFVNSNGVPATAR